MDSLRVRLLLSNVIMIAVTLGLTAIGVYVFLDESRDNVTYQQIDDVASVLAASPGTPVVGEIGVHGLHLAYAAADGSVIASGEAGLLDGATLGDPVDIENAGPPPVGSRCSVENADGDDLLCLRIPVAAIAGGASVPDGADSLVIAAPIDGSRDAFGDITPRFLLAGWIGLTAAIALGYLLAASISSPLANISRAVRRVGEGNYEQRVTVTGPREVRELAGTINRMTEQVSASERTLRDFLANVSHELKTPLTSVNGFSLAMLDGTVEDEVGREKALRVINQESERLLRLVHDLLDLSRIESGQTLMRRDRLDLTQFLQSAVSLFELRSEETGITLDIIPAGEIYVLGDEDRLEQVLHNLLANAFRHTPAGGHVVVSCRAIVGRFAEVSVADTGSGMSGEDSQHAFDRFYRAGTSADGRGHGLGLAICREIVKAHGGEIMVESSVGKGTTVRFTLPIDPQGAPKAATRILGARQRA